MFALSFLGHLALILLALNFNLLSQQQPVESPAYYVDLVTLPVASPQAGAPQAPSPSPQAAPPREEPESVPVPPAKPVTKGKQKAPPPTAGVQGKGKAVGEESSRDFNERLAKMARSTEQKSYEETLARLKKGGGGKVGIPGGKGTQAGSDYASYIQSRLRDAFRSTIASDTTSPKVSVRITIGVDGRIKRYRVEQSSGDHVFEEAVERAVRLAERSFKPPPSGSDFEQGFVFRPQGVGVR